MSEERINELVDRLSDDADLRDEFRSNPAEVIERHGIELDEDQRDRLSEADWDSVDDDELIARLRTRGKAAWL